MRYFWILIMGLQIFYFNNLRAARFETNPVKDIIQNVSGNVHSIYNQDNNILEIGKEYDDLVKSDSGYISNYTVSFNVKNISDISSFKLSNAGYKDHIIISLNGNLT